MFFPLLEDTLHLVAPASNIFLFCCPFPAFSLSCAVQAVLAPLLCLIRTAMLQDAMTCSSSK